MEANGAWGEGGVRARRNEENAEVACKQHLRHSPVAGSQQNSPAFVHSENRITRTGVGVAFRRAVYVNSTFHGSGQVQFMLYLVGLDIVITFAVEYM